MDCKIGFIGMGNMAKAIAAGFVGSGMVKAGDIYAFAPNQDKLRKNAEAIGFVPVADVRTLVEGCQLIIMACKPYQIEGVIAELDGRLAGKSLLSIAAGWPYAKYAELLAAEGDRATGIQFVMPNTPAMVGRGIFLFEEQGSLKPEVLDYCKQLFNAMGEVMVLPSRLMGIGGTITGCGPAFMDMVMEAFADAAVKYGIGRELAYRMVAGTMAGSAELQLKTGKHPGVLKDEVCSPAGTTICGVEALEKMGLRSACMEAVNAVMNKR